MEFSRPEYWSGYPFPSSGDLPNPGIEPRSPALQTDSLPAEPQGKPNAEAEAPIFRPPDEKTPSRSSLLTGKDPGVGKDCRQKENGGYRGFEGWMASPLNGHEF